MAHDSKYTVHQRLTNAENRCAQLEAEVKALRVHLAGELKTAVADAKNVIQNSIRVPVDGRDGRDGRDGATGLQGSQGERGDCTIPTESELAEALDVLRRKLAKFQAAVLHQYELNTGRTHKGLKAAVDAVLKNIERNAK